MRTYRCPNPHPKWPSQLCNYKMEMEGDGEFTLVCPRCRNYVTLDLRKEYTTALTP